MDFHRLESMFEEINALNEAEKEHLAKIESLRALIAEEMRNGTLDRDRRAREITSLEREREDRKKRIEELHNESKQLGANLKQNQERMNQFVRDEFTHDDRKHLRSAMMNMWMSSNDDWLPEEKKIAHVQKLWETWEGEKDDELIRSQMEAYRRNEEEKTEEERERARRTRGLDEFMDILHRNKR